MEIKKGRIMKKKIMGAFFIALIMVFSFVPLSHVSAEGTAEVKATPVDYLVTEQINIQGDTKGNLSCNPLSISNLSDDYRLDVNNISFNPINSWQIVSSGTDFGKLGKDEKKISLVADNSHDFVSVYANVGSVASNEEKNISISAKKGVTTIATNEAVGNFTVTIDAVELIPVGGVYTQANGTVLYAGDPFPETVAQDDTYEYGDYIYTYAKSTGMNWNAKVKDTSKSSYGELLSEIAGKPMDTMRSTFYGCRSLTTAPEIPDSVKDMYGTFELCTSLTTAPEIPQSVTDMRYTFYDCTSLKTAPEIPDSVKDMYSTFNGCTSLKTAPAIPDSVKDMNGTFELCTSLKTAPEIPNGVTDMSYTFRGCTSLTTAPAIPDSVTNMGSTFYSCTSLTIAPAIPQSVTDMSSTFSDCTSLKTAPEIPDSVKDMYGTFELCTSLTTAPEIPQSVTDMRYTFYGCTSLTGDIIINASPTDYYNCFYGTEKLIYLKGTAGNLEIRREIAKTARSGNVRVYEDINTYPFASMQGKNISASIGTFVDSNSNIIEFKNNPDIITDLTYTYLATNRNWSDEKIATATYYQPFQIRVESEGFSDEETTLSDTYFLRDLETQNKELILLAYDKSSDEIYEYEINYVDFTMPEIGFRFTCDIEENSHYPNDIVFFFCAYDE